MPTANFKPIADQNTVLTGSTGAWTAAITGTWQDVSNLSSSFKSSASVLAFEFVNDLSGNVCEVDPPGNAQIPFRILKDGAVLYSSIGWVTLHKSPTMFDCCANVPAGNFTYKLQINLDACVINYVKMRITELY